MSAIVLCGGGSTRMGVNKADLRFGEETLLQRAVRVVSNVAQDVVVVTHPDRVPKDVPDHARLAFDDVPDLGPLGGLAAGLRAIKHDMAYVTSCDVPFLREAFVRAVLDHVGEHDAAMPECEGFAQPLAAAYRASCVDAVDAMLSAQERRPRMLRKHVSVVAVPEEILRVVDPTLDSLENTNHPQEFDRAVVRQSQRGVTPLTIELFELARHLAGISNVHLEVTSLRNGLAQLAAMHPALVNDVLDEHGQLDRHWRLLRGGKDFVTELDAVPTPHESVALLSALAGG